MSSNWKPWWEKVADYDTAEEKEQFLRGVSSSTPRNSSTTILLGILAHHALGRLTQSKDRR